MKINSIFCILWLLMLPNISFGQQFGYGTASQTALEHYTRGWEHILDKGEWTLAESSFRKAAEIDPGFVLAWSQIGRISHDPEERAKIFQELSTKTTQSDELQRLLLEVYLASMQLIDLKDRGIAISPDMVVGFYELSERNFKTFLQSFPHEPYIQAEYIEVIHGQYGPSAALDSIEILAKTEGHLIPFLVSYKAQMFAELKEHENAVKAAEELERYYRHEKPPILAFTRAYIYFENQDLQAAEREVKEVLRSDPNHVLAQRLKFKIIGQ